MTAKDELHVDRARAASFGAVAADYDRFRPAYPDALLDDLAALAPTDVLDVACGTGKVAAALLARGLDVLGIEPDARMAEVARAHGVRVEVATFEAWPDAGRRVDLITCGQGWHWVDPAAGLAKAAAVLRPGGSIARFWSYATLDAGVQERIDGVYQRCAPSLARSLATGRPPRAVRLDGDPFTGAEAFTAAHQRTYTWERPYSAQEWVGLVATHSDHLLLPAAEREALLQGLGAVVTDLGGSLVAHYRTDALLARRG